MSSVSWFMAAILATLSASMVIAVVRLILGPTLADRVVALDLVAVSGVGLMGAAAIALELTALLDVAILLALIGFIGTAAFASFLERRTER